MTEKTYGFIWKRLRQISKGFSLGSAFIDQMIGTEVGMPYRAGQEKLIAIVAQEQATHSQPHAGYKAR